MCAILTIIKGTLGTFPPHQTTLLYVSGFKCLRNFGGGTMIYLIYKKLVIVPGAQHHQPINNAPLSFYTLEEKYLA